MTTVATKITTEWLSLDEAERLEVLSKLAVAAGMNSVSEAVENAIAERRLDALENGHDKGLTEEEVFGNYPQSRCSLPI